MCFLSALLCRLWLWGGLFGVGGVKIVEFVIDVVIVGVIFVVCVAVVVGDVVVVVVVVVSSIIMSEIYGILSLPVATTLCTCVPSLTLPSP